MAMLKCRNMPKRKSTNRCCKSRSGYHLFESVGFRHVPPDSLPPNPYTHANVFMQMPL